MMKTAPFLTHPLLDCPGVSHGFFTRHGGVSCGLYDSLNGGLGSQDNLDHVAENRAIAMNSITLDAAENTSQDGDDHLCGLYQIHSALCHRVGRQTTLRQEGDAMVTTDTGVTCVILTADCVPVLCVDPVHQVIAAAHAGWRGAVSGIIASTINAMEEAGASRGHIRAVTGPAIQQASYQVGADLRASVLAASPDAEHVFKQDHTNDRWLFDLPRYVLEQLQGLGITAASMEEDTYTDDRFFSHRRATHENKPDSGRSMAMIRLNHPQENEK